MIDSKLITRVCDPAGYLTSMTITINLPPATGDRLRAQAEATGKELGAWVIEAVEARLALTQMSLRDILAPVHEDFRTSGMTELELEAFLNESLEKTRSTRKHARDTSV